MRRGGAAKGGTAAPVLACAAVLLLIIAGTGKTPPREQEMGSWPPPSSPSLSKFTEPALPLPLGSPRASNSKPGSHTPVEIKSDSQAPPTLHLQSDKKSSFDAPNFFCAPTSVSNDDPTSKKPGYVFVTAASRNHFLSVQYFLINIKRVEPSRQVVVYDLDFSPEQKVAIRCSGNVIVREFPYHKYPTFVNVTVNAGQYAWKPLIIHQLLSEWDGVIWSDSGNRYQASLDPLISYAENVGNGFYSADSAGTVGSFIHPGVLEYFHVSNFTSSLPNCNAALLIFNQQAADLVKAWAECALVERCIAPPGSSRKNHRQDQAILTFLIYSGVLKDTRPACCQEQPRFRCGSITPNRKVYSFHHDAKSENDYARICALAVPVSADSALRHLSLALSSAGAPSQLVPSSRNSAIVVLALLLGTHNDPRHVAVVASSQADEWAALAVLSTLGVLSSVTLIRLGECGDATPFAHVVTPLKNQWSGVDSMQYRYGGRGFLHRICASSLIPDAASWTDLAKQTSPLGAFHFVFITKGAGRALSPATWTKVLQRLVKRSSRIGWGIVAENAIEASLPLTLRGVPGGGYWESSSGDAAKSLDNVALLLSW